ncbi:hypothetical protein MLD38_023203 [Melastoma candidum]|uniref:Uncharacterized protein n=1 Tax=Melastoma candidum TaxID=119954 RepID=A0ACB9QL36_9MYRT|nr:hypothetical protein MLD38_023203 [Melastoma candidum]
MPEEDKAFACVDSLRRESMQTPSLNAFKFGVPPKQKLFTEFADSITDIDTRGIHALQELHRSLQKRELVLVNPGSVAIDKLNAAGFSQQIGEDKIFLAAVDSVMTFSPRFELEQP